MGLQPWQENTWRSRATYEWVEQALRAMRERAEAEGVESIAIPRIGTGYGGLSWKKLRPLIELAFSGWTGMLYVYEGYVPTVADNEDEANDEYGR